LPDKFFFQTMLEYKTALELIISAAEELSSEKVELQQSLYRILAVNVFYGTDMPPFDKSAMDGFACRKSDLQNVLEITETIFAGKSPEKRISKNKCSKIMTGAVVPKGADFVFTKENAEMLDGNRVKCLDTLAGNHICYKGEDVKRGDKVLDKSTRILSRHLPLLAGAGVCQPEVFLLPGVTVFATGTELVEPHIKPEAFQIRNSNSPQLMAQLAEMNISANYCGILADKEETLTEKISEAFNSDQVVILTGGVSVGDFDLVPGILKKLGFRILVNLTAIKPGKPMVFARKGNSYCFGLSGNPVSSFIQFELYVKPFLFALMGHIFLPPVFKLPLGEEISRDKSDRVHFFPAIVSSDMEVFLLEFHGSAHIHALSQATHLLEIPINVELIKKGTLVDVRPL
jgi:molybdopterin molybdotransferase